MLRLPKGLKCNRCKKSLHPTNTERELYLARNASGITRIRNIPSYICIDCDHIYNSTQVNSTMDVLYSCKIGDMHPELCKDRKEIEYEEVCVLI